MAFGIDYHLIGMGRGAIVTTASSAKSTTGAMAFGTQSRLHGTCSRVNFEDFVCEELTSDSYDRELC